MPTVQITSPINNALLNEPASITINASAADIDGTISSVNFYNGTNLIGSDNTAPYNYTWNNVLDGSYILSAKAIDNNGGEGISSNVNIKVDPIQSRLIQAEAYTTMLGVSTEPTLDIDGVLNVGYIDAGDWMAYNTITFPTSGNYTIEYRVASISGGMLSSDLNAGSIQLGSLNVPPTGGWQSWMTISQTVNVTAGTYNFGVFAKTGGWNLNWIRITKQSLATARQEQLNSVSGNLAEANFGCYPNPAFSVLYFNSSQELLGSTIQVFDQNGKKVLSTLLDEKSIDINSLPAGLYSLVLFNNEVKLSRRFVKQ